MLFLNKQLPLDEEETQFRNTKCPPPSPPPPTKEKLRPMATGTREEMGILSPGEFSIEFWPVAPFSSNVYFWLANIIKLEQDSKLLSKKLLFSQGCPRNCFKLLNYRLFQELFNKEYILTTFKMPPSLTNFFLEDWFLFLPAKGLWATCWVCLGLTWWWTHSGKSNRPYFIQLLRDTGGIWAHLSHSVSLYLPLPYSGGTTEAHGPCCGQLPRH